VFVVGEERGSDGARRKSPWKAAAISWTASRPTSLAWRADSARQVESPGRAAHSSFPELGESAIDKLLDALIELRSIAFWTTRCWAHYSVV
jgi:acetylornithine deacetylase